MWATPKRHLMGRHLLQNPQRDLPLTHFGASRNGRTEGKGILGVWAIHDPDISWTYRNIEVTFENRLIPKKNNITEVYPKSTSVSSFSPCKVILMESRSPPNLCCVASIQLQRRHPQLLQQGTRHSPFRRFLTGRNGRWKRHGGSQVICLGQQMHRCLPFCSFFTCTDDGTHTHLRWESSWKILKKLWK